MIAELLLLTGIDDTCRALLTDALTGCGVGIGDVQTPDADPSALKKALRTAVSRSDVIVVCGGIGFAPTDRTVSTVCAAIGSATRSDPATLARLKAAYPNRADFGAAGLVPADATVYAVAEGPLPASVLTAGTQRMLLLPGDAATLRAMLVRHLSVMLGLSRGFTIPEDDAPVPSVTPDADTAVFVPKEAVLLADDEEEDVPVPVEMSVPAEDAADSLGEFTLPAEAQDELFTPVSLPAEDTSDTVGEFTLPAEEVDTAIAPDVIPYGTVPPEPVDEFAAVLAQPAGEPEAADEPKKKKNPFVAVLSFLLPWKGDKALDVIRKFVFLIAIVGLIVSGVYVYDYFAAKMRNDNLLNSQRELYNPEDNKVNADGTLHRFDKLLSQNDNCVGWITIDGTKIDNPVYQSSDNDFYVNHDATGAVNNYGAIFADYRCTVEGENASQNLTLYGHHMKDGSMFANLHKYKQLSFYQEHPLVTLDTLTEGRSTYKIFACMITNAEAKDDGGYVFNYTIPSFESDEAFLSWVEQVRRRSLYITPVDVVAGDRILTLSTCTYEIKGVELRCVVLARKLRDGESDRVNVSEVSANKSVIYPYVWYQHKGGAKPLYDDGLLTWLAQPNYVEPVYPTSSEPDASQPDASSDASASEATSSQETAASEPTASEAPPASSQDAPPPASSQEAASEPTSSEAPPASSQETASEEPPASSQEATPE